MSNFKEKAQIFVIGLSIGLLIAGAFFILKLDDYFKELNFYKSAPSQNQLTEISKNEDVSVFEKVKKSNLKSSKSKVIPSSIQKNITESNSELTLDSNTIITNLKSDSITESFIASNDIVVRKDELLSTKTLEVFNLNPTANKLSAKDSLLQKVSNIKDDRFAGKQMFNIEFWQSPLNYKGYKMSKYKMVLYGIASADGLRIYKLDDIIYLKTVSAIYRLDYASDFKQYERITDETIVTKLK